MEGSSQWAALHYFCTPKRVYKDLRANNFNETIGSLTTHEKANHMDAMLGPEVIGGYGNNSISKNNGDYWIMGLLDYGNDGSIGSIGINNNKEVLY